MSTISIRKQRKLLETSLTQENKSLTIKKQLTDIKAYLESTNKDQQVIN